MKKTTFSASAVDKIAKLANLPLTPKQKDELGKQVGVTVSYVSHLASLPTQDVVETSQVTGLENVFREDVIDSSHILTQKEALSNAKRTHSGYIVVDHIFEE